MGTTHLADNDGPHGSEGFGNQDTQTMAAAAVGQRTDATLPSPAGNLAGVGSGAEVAL